MKQKKIRIKINNKGGYYKGKKRPNRNNENKNP